MSKPIFSSTLEKEFLPISLEEFTFISIMNYGEDEQARKDVIKKTYENAIKNGDKNVYFIDGEEYFKDFLDKELCFIDTIHPNDLGFYKMAQIVEPVIKEILENENN